MSSSDPFMTISWSKILAKSPGTVSEFESRVPNRVSSLLEDTHNLYYRVCWNLVLWLPLAVIKTENAVLHSKEPFPAENQPPVVMW